MNDQEAPVNEEVERLIRQPTRQPEARARLREILDASPRTLAYQQWLHKIPAAEDPVRIALLSSFTLQTIEPFLQVEAFLSGWRPASTYLSYVQWQAALLGEHDWEAKRYRGVVLLLNDTELLAGVGFDPDAAADRLEALLSAFRAQTSTPLFVGVIAPPAINARAFGEDWGTGREWARREYRRNIGLMRRRYADVHLLDLDAGTVGTSDWFDAKGFLATQSIFSHRALPGVARSIARGIGCLIRPRRKALVLDLDNTLWGGIVGEDGIDGVAVGTQWPGCAYVDFQRQLKDLRATGILLAVASKNNDSDARAVFERRPEMALSLADITAWRVDWSDKAANLVAISNDLGLGLDSLVFADDSPIECARVRAALPQVEVVELGKDPSRFMSRILQTQAFDTLSISAEDKRRAQSYAAEEERRTLRARLADLNAFLSECRIHVNIAGATPANLDRVHQLLLKTNQFNFTLERPEKPYLLSVAKEPQRLFAVYLRDRFDDYGLIGVVHLEPEANLLRLRNVVLSCRALGRGVEDAILAFAQAIATSKGLDTLCTTCVKGPRNQQVFEYLERMGFDRHETDAAVHFTRDIRNARLPWPTCVTVTHPMEEEVANE